MVKLHQIKKKKPIRLKTESLSYIGSDDLDDNAIAMIELMLDGLGSKTS